MKKRRIRLKTKLIIAAVVFLLVFAAAMFLNNAANVMISVSSASMRALNTRAVNEAVDSAFGNTSYSDIVTITYDSSGDVAAVTADSSKINAISRNTAYLTQSALERLSADGTMIPLGAFTGIEALSGYGRSVCVKVVPVISVECNFVSRFSQAGINQTIHSVYIDVVTDITIVLAARTERVFATAEVLVCESIINGKIPEVYLQGGMLGGGMLVP